MANKPTSAGEAYPPQVFKSTQLISRMQELGKDEVWLIQLLRISHITARRILRGCDLKLSHAVKIAHELDIEVDALWVPLKKK